MKPKLCELCSNEASVYCGADSAFLCRSCDARVHAANFLVARHIRQFLCPKCNMVTAGSISGSAVEFKQNPNCQSCSSPSENQKQQHSSASPSSDCISTTKYSANNTTPFDYHKRKANQIASSSSLTHVSFRSSGEVTSNKRKKRETAPSPSKKVDAKAEGIFVNWCRSLGIYGNGSDVLLTSASEALGLCLKTRFSALPFRVCLAASFWFGLRAYGASQRSLLTWQNLRRLEQVSGVTCKLILAVEMKLTRAIKFRRERPPLDLEEGWAESS